MSWERFKRNIIVLVFPLKNLKNMKNATLVGTGTVRWVTQQELIHAKKNWSIFLSLHKQVLADYVPSSFYAFCYRYDPPQ